MGKRKQNEGRSKKRVSVDHAVRVRCEDWDSFQTEYAGNISEGGIFVQTKKPLSPGTIFSLELSVAGENFLAKAQVIWTKEFSDESRHSGMGARFVEMSDESEEILHKWIKQSDR
jgi:uncharacterized protein (TIGR02266 family)